MMRGILNPCSPHPTACCLPGSGPSDAPHTGCRYEGNILILSGDAKAVFDESGNMLELYDLKQDAQENLAGRKEAAELEFEMILLLSKFNME